MESKEPEAQAEADSEPEDQKQKPPTQWKKVFRGAWHDLSPGYLPNIIVSLVAALITPVLGLIINSPKTIVVGVALALTIVIWGGAIAVIRRLPPPAKDEPPIAAASPTASPTPPAVRKPVAPETEQLDPVMIFNDPITITPKDGGEKVTLTVMSQIRWDVPNQAMTVTYSVPDSRYTAEVCAALPEQVDKLLDRAKKLRVRGEEWKPGERPMQLQTARFTGRVFIYHASHLYSDEIDELTALFKKKNLTPQFRRTPPPVVTRTPSVTGTPPQKQL